MSNAKVWQLIKHFLYIINILANASSTIRCLWLIHSLSHVTGLLSFQKNNNLGHFLNQVLIFHHFCVMSLTLSSEKKEKKKKLWYGLLLAVHCFAMWPPCLNCLLWFPVMKITGWFSMPCLLPESVTGFFFKFHSFLLSNQIVVLLFLYMANYISDIIHFQRKVTQEHRLTEFLIQRFRYIENFQLVYTEYKCVTGNSIL